MVKRKVITGFTLQLLALVTLTLVVCLHAYGRIQSESASYFNKPVAYWAFEGNGRDSAGNHDLAIGVGAPNPAPYGEGKIGQAMNQQGNSPAFIASRTPDFDFSRDFTIAVWVYRNESIYDNDAILDTGSIYIAKRDAAPWNSRFGVLLHKTGGEQQIELVDNSKIGPPAINTWYHVIVFRKGNTVGIKVNNEGMSMVDVADLNLAGGLMMFVGIQQCGYPWQGRLDELGIWNRTLTDYEMAALYNNGAGRRL
jgi:hypothetical protein